MDFNLSSVVAEVLHTARAVHQPPSRMDVADMVDLEIGGQEVEEQVMEELISTAWLTVLRVWWLTNCVPG